MSLLNPKCLAVSAVAVGLYHTYPTRDAPGVLLNTAALASAVYIGLAWYDYKFDCDDKPLASEWFRLYRPFKPPVGAIDGRYGGG